MDIQGMTPEQINQMLLSGEDDPQFEAANQKQRIADAMRQQSMDKIEGRQIGQVYHGGTLADPIAKIAQAYQSNQMGGQAQGMREQAQGRVVDSRKAYGQAMIDALRKRTAAPSTPPQSMAGPGNGVDDFGGGGIPSGGY